jgi:putative membrane protein
MEQIIDLSIGLIALIHFYIFIFEAFLWETRGPRVFQSFNIELFAKTKALAFNQGVYNLFLSAGLIWTFFIDNSTWKQNISIFFLGCVVFAGLAGSLTEKKIFYIQSLPALIVLLVFLFQ